MKPLREAVRISNPRTLLLLFCSLGLVIAGCSSDSAVEARDADPVINFDGEECSYDGPSAIKAGGIEFTLTNSSDHTIAMTAIHFETQAQFEAEIELLPVGTDAEPLRDSLPDGASLQLNLRSEPGEEAASLGAFEPGSYVVDCFTTPPDASFPNYVWRAGTFEVVESS